MNRKWLGIGALIVTAILLVSCGGQGQSTGPAPMDSVEQNASSSSSKSPIATPDRYDSDATKTPYDVSKSPATGGLTASETQLQNQSSQLSFLPSEDGFGFKNFVGGSGSAAITIPDLIEFYGEDGLCSEGSGDSCVPYPGVVDFLGQLNQVLQNGLCYGFSAASTNLFADNEDLLAFDVLAENTFALKRSESVERTIARWHMLQFTEEFRDEVDRYRELSPTEIARQLKQQFDSTQDKVVPPMTLNLYASVGGHSVTPVSVRETVDGYVIEVYDSNWPGQLRQVTVGNHGEWSYQGAHENPEEQSMAWSESGPDTMALIPHILTDSNFRCFFCENPSEGVEGTGSVMILNAADSEQVTITVTDQRGHSIKKGTESNVIEIDGAKIYVLPGESFGNDAFLIYLPPETLEFSVLIDSKSETSKDFTYLHAGEGHPTTSIRGSAVSGVDDMPTLEVKVDEDGSIETIINPDSVEQVKQATSRSTILFEPRDNERYQANFHDGVIDDVKIIDTETNQVTESLQEIFQKTEFPIRPMANDDGTRFVKTSEVGIRIELNDGIEIRKSNKKEDLSGIEVDYPDGVSGAFIDDADGTIVGSMSDGATSLKFKDGGAIHSTKDGWIVHERQKGDYEIFKKENGTLTEIRSKDQLQEFDNVPKNISSIINESTPKLDNERDQPESGAKDEVEVKDQLSERIEALDNFQDKLSKRHPTGIEPEKLLEEIMDVLDKGTLDGEEGDLISVQEEPVEEVRGQIQEKKSEDDASGKEETYQDDEAERKIQREGAIGAIAAVEELLQGDTDWIDPDIKRKFETILIQLQTALDEDDGDLMIESLNTLDELFQNLPTERPREITQRIDETVREGAIGAIVAVEELLQGDTDWIDPDIKRKFETILIQLQTALDEDDGDLMIESLNALDELFQKLPTEPQMEARQQDFETPETRDVRPQEDAEENRGQVQDSSQFGSRVDGSFRATGDISELANVLREFAESPEKLVDEMIDEREDNISQESRDQLKELIKSKSQTFFSNLRTDLLEILGYLDEGEQEKALRKLDDTMASGDSWGQNIVMPTIKEFYEKMIEEAAQRLREGAAATILAIEELLQGEIDWIDADTKSAFETNLVKLQIALDENDQYLMVESLNALSELFQSLPTQQQSQVGDESNTPSGNMPPMNQPDIPAGNMPPMNSP